MGFVRGLEAGLFLDWVSGMYMNLVSLSWDELRLLRAEGTGEGGGVFSFRGGSGSVSGRMFVVVSGLFASSRLVRLV